MSQPIGRKPVSLPWAAAVCLLIAAVVASGRMPSVVAQAPAPGVWQTLPYQMPINPIHAALMHTGKVLIVAGSGNDGTVTDFRAAVWDPVTGTIVTQPTVWDMFCNGMVALADGRIFVNGGNTGYDPSLGERRSAVFDPDTSTFTDVELMTHGRWYPTVTLLGDGRVMTFSGLNEIGGTNVTNKTVEIYTVGTGWSPEYLAGWLPPLYPWMHLLPNGQVAVVGSVRDTRLFNPSTMQWSGILATTNYTGSRKYGSSVLLPLRASEGYKARVMILGGNNPATATTEVIDFSVPTLQWQSGPPMSQPRIEMNATLLPNGRVLVTGGSLNDEDATTASLNADLYDPATNSFSSAGANAYPRLYHSISLLLPDATVAVAGGNPRRGSYEPRIEIYSPAYLFNQDGSPAMRPTIASVTPGTVPYGSTFVINTSDAANIASVVIVRPGAVTHAFDMDQRLIALSFTKGTGTLTVTAPPNGNIAPPGYYMVFILNSAGVPSVAKFIRMDAPTSTAGLVAAYAFNEGAGGSVGDVSGNGNTGTISGGATWDASGKYGSALRFDGTTSRVSIADAPSLDLTDAFTLEGWVFPTVTLSYWRTLIGKNTDRYYLMASSNLNTPATGGTFGTTNQNVYAPAALAVNTWTHLAATYDRSTIRLYVNGAQVATGSQTAAVSTSTGTLSIGSNAYGEYFTGLIDEVRVYNRALTIDEIQRDMTTPLGTSGGSNQPPTATITSPASNVTINPGQSVSFAGSGSDPDGSITGYAWSFPGGTPGSSSVAAPGAITYSTSGTYTASLRVTDNAGAQSSPTTRTVTVANFSMTASPASNTVSPGGQATYTATVTPGQGFTGTVSFGVAGLPAGTSASFNPTSVSTSGQTTLTVSTTGSAPAGSYPLTITGTSASVSRSANVTLVISSSQPPTATITSPAGNVTVNPGGSVNFAGSGSDPDGSISTYAWAFPGGSPSSSNVAVPGNVTYATPGSYTASLTVTDNSGNSSTPATRTVTVANFSVSATPSSISVSPGAGATYTATVTPSTGFSGTVTFSVTGLPAGTSASFNPISLNTSGQTTLTVTTSSSTPAGSYVLTVRGTSGTVTRTANVTLVVIGTFSILVTPANGTIAPGGTASYTVTVSGQNSPATITLSVAGLPKFTTGKFTPPSIVNSGTSTLTITSNRNVARGTYPLTVSGSGGGVTRSTTVTLTVQ